MSIYTYISSSKSDIKVGDSVGLQDIDDSVHDILRDALKDDNLRRHYSNAKVFTSKAIVSLLRSNSSRMRPEVWERVRKELNGIGF